MTPSNFWNFGLSSSSLPTCGLQLRIRHPLSKSNFVSLCRPSLLLPVEIHHFFSYSCRRYTRQVCRAQKRAAEVDRSTNISPSLSLFSFMTLMTPAAAHLVHSFVYLRCPHFITFCVYRYGGRLHRHLTPSQRSSQNGSLRQERA